MNFPACLYDYWMKVWIWIGQKWALISTRNWPEEDSLHFHMGLFTSSLRKDSKSMHFLSESLMCSNQHPEDRKFHHLLLIACVMAWSLKVKVLILFYRNQQSICWASVRPRTRHVQTQFMVTCQTCELYGFYSLSLNGWMAEVPICFWKVTSMLHFLSKEQNSLLHFLSKDQNSPITADSEG